METKKDTSEKSSEKMTRVQKVIVILTAVVLAIIMILVAATQYMGSSTTYPIDAITDITVSDETTDNSEKDTVYPGDTDSDGGASIEIGEQNSGTNTDGKYDDKQSENSGQTGDKDLADGKDNFTNQNDDSGDDSSGDDKAADTDHDQNTDDGTNKENPDNTGSAEGGINSGDSITITSIGESAVTVQIGRETIVIPVQTTSFNGRNTKSGVISETLCGYSIGASVMLYYPEGGSLDGVTLTGAYVKVDNTRLTVSGDYNGDGSKIVFRINGVKLP